jgi:single-strand DNA-binding protein
MSIPTTIVGNTTADAELRFTQGGLAVAGFTVAVNERKFNRETNEWTDGDTTFVRCSVWREMAEQVANSIPKGTRVIVTGKLKMQEYENKEGVKGSSLEMQVDEIGPSLRYASAVVTKAARREGGAPGQQQTPQGYGQQQPAGYGQQQPAGYGQPQQGWAQPQQQGGFAGPGQQQPWGQPQQPQQQPWGAGAGNPAYGDDQPF